MFHPCFIRGRTLRRPEPKAGFGRPCLTPRRRAAANLLQRLFVDVHGRAEIFEVLLIHLSQPAAQLIADLRIRPLINLHPQMGGQILKPTGTPQELIQSGDGKPIVHIHVEHILVGPDSSVQIFVHELVDLRDLEQKIFASVGLHRRVRGIPIQVQQIRPRIGFQKHALHGRKCVRIVRREGIGDVLANGTHWAAEEIGKGAHEYAHNNIKKHEQLPLKLSMLNPIYFLMYATGEKMNITQIEGQFPQAPYPRREHREAFVKDWFQVPDEKFKQYFLDWEPRGEKSIPYYPTPDMCCDIVDWQERMHYIDDSTGMCAGLSSFPYKPPFHIHKLPTLIAAGAAQAQGIYLQTTPAIAAIRCGR